MKEAKSRQLSKIFLSSAPLALFIGFIIASIDAISDGRKSLATIWLVLGWVTAVAGVYLAEIPWKVSSKTRIVSTITTSVIAAIICGLTLNYAEKPKQRKSSQPPLALLIDPGNLKTLTEFVATRELSEKIQTPIPIRMDSVPIPKLGYSGFDSDPDNDDLALGTRLAIENTSDSELTLNFSLSVSGEGIFLSADGSGKGRWFRRLGVNDWITENSKAKGKTSLRFLTSPLILPARSKASGFLMFVLTTEEQRQAASKITSSGKFRYVLSISEVRSRKLVSLTLPNRYPEISDFDLQSYINVRFGNPSKKTE